MRRYVILGASSERAVSAQSETARGERVEKERQDQAGSLGLLIASREAV